MQLAADLLRDERTRLASLPVDSGIAPRRPWLVRSSARSASRRGRSDEARPRAGVEFSHSPKAGWRANALQGGLWLSVERWRLRTKVRHVGQFGDGERKLGRDVE